MAPLDGAKTTCCSYKASSPFAGVQPQFSIKRCCLQLCIVTKGFSYRRTVLMDFLLLTRYTDLPTVCPAVKLNCTNTVQSLVNVFSLKVRK